jgi:hypothetical protein
MKIKINILDEEIELERNLLKRENLVNLYQTIKVHIPNYDSESMIIISDDGLSIDHLEETIQDDIKMKIEHISASIKIKLYFQNKLKTLCVSKSFSLWSILKRLYPHDLINHIVFSNEVIHWDENIANLNLCHGIIWLVRKQQLKFIQIDADPILTQEDVKISSVILSNRVRHHVSKIHKTEKHVKDISIKVYLPNSEIILFSFSDIDTFDFLFMQVAQELEYVDISLFELIYPITGERLQASSKKLCNSYLCPSGVLRLKDK